MIDIRIVDSMELGIEENEYSDGLFRRLTKNKDDYYKEGIEICGKYYKKVYQVFKKNMDDVKDDLKRDIKEKDDKIANLKEILLKYKEKDTKDKNTDDSKSSWETDQEESLAIECITLFIEEKNLIEDIEGIEKKYQLNELSVGGFPWLF